VGKVVVLIDVTESEITTDVRVAQPLKALGPINVTESGITTDGSFIQ
jgi:hypothetical protein